MGIIASIREKMAVSKAKMAGRDPQAYKEYYRKKQLDTFKIQEEAKRKQEERFVREKARLETDAKLKKIKERGGSSLLGSALKSYGKKLKAKKSIYQGTNNQGSQGIQFGLSNSPFDLRRNDKPNKRGPFQL